MKSIAPIVSILAIGCGGAKSEAPMPPPPGGEPDAVTQVGCENPPGPEPNDPIASDPFSVTGERIAAGTTRPYGLNSHILRSASEGGVYDISIRGENECGLWLVTHYAGSESGGDADVRKTTYSAVPEIDGSYLVEALGASVRVVSSKDGGFLATLTRDIDEYIGE